MLQPSDFESAEQQQRNDVKVSMVLRRGQTKSFKTVINNYLFLKKIGEGAFGQVFLTSSFHDGKLYAVKHIDRALLKKKKFSVKGDKVGGTECSRVVRVVMRCARAAAGNAARDNRDETVAAQERRAPVRSNR